jgi:tetratricopeptide (TPR) repeat protein
VNAGKYKTVFRILLVLVFSQAALADSAGVSTSQACPELVERGNKLYKQGNFNEAINSYDQALIDAPGALEPKFNQANSYYRLDDLSKAMDLFRQVAAESKDMKVVAKAKYNLGNSYFQQGSKQKDSNLQKAIDDLKTAIGSWRGVLDIEPENKKAAKNIEVARLLIKDLLDQLNKQQQQQENQQQQDSSHKILIRHKTSSRKSSKKTGRSNSRLPPIQRHRKFWIKNSAGEKKDGFCKEVYGKKSKKTGSESWKRLFMIDY